MQVLPVQDVTGFSQAKAAAAAVVGADFGSSLRAADSNTNFAAKDIASDGRAAGVIAQKASNRMHKESKASRREQVLQQPTSSSETSRVQLTLALPPEVAHLSPKLMDTPVTDAVTLPASLPLAGFGVVGNEQLPDLKTPVTAGPLREEAQSTVFSQELPSVHSTNKLAQGPDIFAPAPTAEMQPARPQSVTKPAGSAVEPQSAPEASGGVQEHEISAGNVASLAAISAQGPESSSPPTAPSESLATKTSPSKSTTSPLSRAEKTAAGLNATPVATLHPVKTLDQRADRSALPFAESQSIFTGPPLTLAEELPGTAAETEGSTSLQETSIASIAGGPSAQGRLKSAAGPTAASGPAARSGVLEAAVSAVPNRLEMSPFVSRQLSEVNPAQGAASAAPIRMASRNALSATDASKAQPSEVTSPLVREASGPFPGVLSPAQNPVAGHTSPQTAAVPSSTNEVNASLATAAFSHAKLLQTAQGSTMQVSLASGELGRVLVRANYSHNVLTAQISAESAQLGAAIAAHLPAAEQKLGEHGMRAAFSVAEAAGSSTASPADTSSRREQDPRQPAVPWVPQRAFSQPFASSLAQETSQHLPGEGRINIRI